MLSCPIVRAARRLPSASRFPRPSRRPTSSIARSIASPLPNVSQGSSSHPRSTHSIAKAIVPPALIVSMPSSSHRLEARSTASASLTPHERAQREQALVLQPDAAGVAERVDVLAPDGAGGAARARPGVRGAELLRRDAGGPFERAALEVARRQRAEAIERQQVGRGAQLAVLGGCGTERPFRQVPAVLGQLARVRPLAALRAAHGDGLDVLAAQHGPAPAAAGVATVVRDRRVADRVLAGRADRRRSDNRRRAALFNAASVTWHVAPRRSSAASRRTRPSSMINTESSAARPTMTIASQPHRLPAIAKPLLASESLIRSVSGLLLTTANFADVVSGLPTSGLKANTSGAVGRQRIGSTPRLLPAAARRPVRSRRGTAAEPFPEAARDRRSRVRRRCGDSSRGNRKAQGPSLALSPPRRRTGSGRSRPS